MTSTERQRRRISKAITNIAESIQVLEELRKDLEQRENLNPIEVQEFTIVSHALSYLETGLDVLRDEKVRELEVK